ncbi:MAG: DUF262 domain-containing protein [Patescibacteria group bacterium]|jgi:hypothetical protein
MHDNQSQKYSVNQYLISFILNWVQSGEIAIPEIQRPFVWDATKVRNLMDSLYQGFPIGYLISWRNPTVRLKDGSVSEGKKILIDGQQRVTAMTAAILGQQIIDKDYRKKRIKIAFHPIDERFEVFNPAIEKDVSWIPDIAPIIQGDQSLLKLIRDYCAHNPQVNEEQMEKTIERLRGITKRQIGVIELSGDLDIDTVTEIFVRINSEGVVLSQADFAMSKIASNETYNGSELRKCIDYFCHLAIMPEFYNQLHEVDKEFVNNDYFAHMNWLKNEKDDLYDPDYKDVLRVIFTTEFGRGKLADLVGLLSGRNFETRTYEERIIDDTFSRLKKSLLDFMNETSFKRFLMIIRSTGFIDKEMIRSKNSLNFAYTLYLALRKKNYPPEKIERMVRRWFILSILTGRYSGSPESQIDYDIKMITQKNIEDYIKEVEDAELSEAFWSAGLVQHFDSSVASSPYYNVFLASQVKARDKGFLSREITVADLITHRGDIHHLFPKDFLKRKGLSKGDYNQIANYVYMQSETNIKISNEPPKDYLKTILNQVNNGQMQIGAITDEKSFKENLKQNCIPESILEADFEQYEIFLKERRKLMANKIKEYYLSL